MQGEGPILTRINLMLGFQTKTGLFPVGTVL